MKNALFASACAAACLSAGLNAWGGQAYRQTNLISDDPVITAAHTDPNLVNPWGISFSPAGPFWVANNGTATTTLYDGTGQTASSPIAIPPAIGATTALPTGTVYNGTSAFIVKQSALQGPALFLFATEGGTISGWNPTVSASSAVNAVDRSAFGAVYKGLALGVTGGRNQLYAADFHNAKLDVFTSKFRPVNVPGTFNDPNLPAGYAPFNVESFSNLLYVAYAKQDPQGGPDEVAGAGEGFVNVFRTNGQFVRRLASRGKLNAPWGMAIAPSNFGPLSKSLLVGNFGDGKINAFDPATGKFKGTLKDSAGHPVVIDGLWDLTFGNGAGAGPTNRLFFTAGPDDEQHGLFGSLRVVTTTSAAQAVTTTSAQPLLLDQALAGPSLSIREVASSVPEPGSAALFAIAGLLGLRRSRKARALNTRA